MSNYKKNKKFAVSFAEILIIPVLVVIIVIAMSVPKSGIPGQEKIMFLKAYSTVEKIVGELINNETLYPKNPDMVGFRNLVEVTGKNGTQISGEGKFKELFIENLDITEKYKDGSFKTSDGIKWQLSDTAFQNPAEVETTIRVTPCSDISYDILVNYEGKLRVTDQRAESYINHRMPDLNIMKNTVNNEQNENLNREQAENQNMENFNTNNYAPPPPPEPEYNAPEPENQQTEETNNPPPVEPEPENNAAPPPEESESLNNETGEYNPE